MTHVQRTEIVEASAFIFQKQRLLDIRGVIPFYNSGLIRVKIYLPTVLRYVFGAATLLILSVLLRIPIAFKFSVWIA